MTPSAIAPKFLNSRWTTPFFGRASLKTRVESTAPNRKSLVV
jgi:hypothetical protein